MKAIAVMDIQVVDKEMEAARATFRRLVAGMTGDDLRRRSNGTRWTNRELLFHLLLGYLVVRRLMWMVKLLGLLPRGATKPFAALLNLATRPFDFVNYLGSRIGGKLYSPAHMVTAMDRVTANLARQRARESDRGLQRGMCFPTRWDPFFAGYMTVADLYHYPTQHFDFHARQLNLGRSHMRHRSTLPARIPMVRR
jgi:hypothetical protein